MTARKDVHIGHEIERVLHASGMSVTEFAARICCNRKNVYDIFRRKSIQMDQIIRISEVLNYDFVRQCYYDEADWHKESKTLKIKLLIDGEKVSLEQCDK